MGRSAWGYQGGVGGFREGNLGRGRPYSIHGKPATNGVDGGVGDWAVPESIELFIEGQAVLRSYDSAPRPTPPPPISHL